MTSLNFSKDEASFQSGDRFDRCYDGDCGHYRRHHAGQLGEAHCTVGQCLCPDFLAEPYWDGPEGRFPRVRRWWTQDRREWDPTWYQKAGWPHIGGDEWGRRVATVGFGFLGYLSIVYRTCWCNDCHEVREQTYRLIRRSWDDLRKHRHEREVMRVIFDPAPEGLHIDPEAFK